MGSPSQGGSSPRDPVAEADPAGRLADRTEEHLKREK